jgi:hypothetical protein
MQCPIICNIKHVESAGPLDSLGILLPDYIH